MAGYASSPVIHAALYRSVPDLITPMCLTRLEPVLALAAIYLRT